MSVSILSKRKYDDISQEIEEDDMIVKILSSNDIMDFDKIVEKLSSLFNSKEECISFLKDLNK